MDGTFDLDGAGGSDAVCRWSDRAGRVDGEKEIASLFEESSLFAEDRDSPSRPKVSFHCEAPENNG